MSKKDITKNISNPEKIEGKGFKTDVDEAFHEYLISSDKPQCEYKRGDRVEKATYEKGDFHPIGQPGIVIGNLYDDEVGEAYLVQFEGDEYAAFTLKYKIKLV